MPNEQLVSYIMPFMVRTSYFWWYYDNVCFVLDQYPYWIFIVRAHWNSPWVDMAFYSNTLTCFQANQSLLLLLNTCIMIHSWRRSLNHQLYSLWFHSTSDWTDDLPYWRWAYVNYYTTEAVLMTVVYCLNSCTLHTTGLNY